MMKYKTMLIRVALALVACAGPLAFPLAVAGEASLDRLARVLILPSAAVLAIAWAALKRRGPRDLADAVAKGAAAGALATPALEAIRYTGFHFGFMPGNLPELMGVLLLNRFALGPSAASTLAGFTYHFWNGAAFGVVFALLGGRRRKWWAVPYALAIGLGFLVSPVVQALGVGRFGKEFGWHFAATVLIAHAAFGAALGWTLGRLTSRLGCPDGACANSVDRLPRLTEGAPWR